MSKSEFVGLSNVEKIYGQKELYNLQLDILDSLSRLKSFKNLRAEEHVLKVAVKSKIGQSIEALDKLRKFLPKTEYRIGEDEDMEKVSEEDLSLTQEIEAIRKKLNRLSEE
jgi:hypothetical protein